MPTPPSHPCPFYVRTLVVALSAIVSAPALAQTAPVPLTRDIRAQVVDSVSGAVRRYYVFADTAKADRRLICNREVAAHAYDTVSTNAGLAAMLTREIAHVHADSHLRIAYDPDEARSALDTSHARPAAARERDRASNYYFTSARILPGNIGLVQFNQFADTSAAVARNRARGDAIRRKRRRADPGPARESRRKRGDGQRDRELFRARQRALE